VSITKQAKRRQWQGTHTLSVILLYVCFIKSEYILCLLTDKGAVYHKTRGPKETGGNIICGSARWI